MKHTKDHAVYGCMCRRADVTNCVMCDRRIETGETFPHFDTCSERCYENLKAEQDKKTSTSGE